MERLALFVQLRARRGKEYELEEFLKSALPEAQRETDTIRWYALKLDGSTFGVFDTFETEEGRWAHLSGPIAAALMEKADKLLSEPASIRHLRLIAVK